MSICEMCKIETNRKYGSGRFCSSNCARKYSSTINQEQKSHNQSISLKLSAQNNPNYGFKNKERQQHANELSQLVTRKNTERKIKNPKLRIFMSTDSFRKIVFQEQNYCCNHCGISHWFGDPITLELEHIDGNTTNNIRENLEGLCPNCHSKTTTWRGRNKNSYNHMLVSDDILLGALQTLPSIRQALISVGMAGKGGNYKRCYQLLANQHNND